MAFQVFQNYNSKHAPIEEKQDGKDDTVCLPHVMKLLQVVQMIGGPNIKSLNGNWQDLIFLKSYSNATHLINGWVLK